MKMEEIKNEEKARKVGKPKATKDEALSAIYIMHIIKKYLTKSINLIKMQCNRFQRTTRNEKLFTQS